MSRYLDDNSLIVRLGLLLLGTDPAAGPRSAGRVSGTSADSRKPWLGGASEAGAAVGQAGVGRLVH